MVWPRVRRSRAAAGIPVPVPGKCTPDGRHSVATERLLLFTPRTQLDAAAAIAAASDPEAQRWLGNHAERIVPSADTKEALLLMGPATDAGHRIPRQLTEPFEPVPGQPDFFVCVRLDNGRYAGALEVDRPEGRLGGWLAPGSRGQGLGSELFRAGALLAHAHFGMDTVRAGTEPQNTACLRALRRAGFVADEGPPRHTLPDGREVDAGWFRHEDGPASRCC
ncbi:GNAT family N-acetyltransferase [Streptomyces sp. NPDC005808]|uniref:GNAT family N-acetyltransferase n=1 Tax=Streptomyces sp. NPDC005808 TaxID=3364734 RepID=UPI0036935825